MTLPNLSYIRVGIWATACVNTYKEISRILTAYETNSVQLKPTNGLFRSRSQLLRECYETAKFNLTK